MDTNGSFPFGMVLGARVHAVSWDCAVGRIIEWAKNRESRCVCICNVHSVVTAGKDANFQTAINSADLATPDGMPVAWVLRATGFPKQARISGPDLLWRVCESVSGSETSVFFYGSTEETLTQLRSSLNRKLPALRIAGLHSPPFRPLSAAEDEEITRTINQSGAGIVFVGLGCPRQETWVAAHRGRIDATMIGVGAAFDFHAGHVARAPAWMQNGGLEWLHRLLSEPGRLWRRYLVTNSLFLLGVARQLLVARPDKQSRLSD